MKSQQRWRKVHVDFGGSACVVVDINALLEIERSKSKCDRGLVHGSAVDGGGGVGSGYCGVLRFASPKGGGGEAVGRRLVAAGDCETILAGAAAGDGDAVGAVGVHP